MDEGPIDNPPPDPEEPKCSAETHPFAYRLRPPATRKAWFGKIVQASGDYFVVGASADARTYVYKKTECGVELAATLTAEPGMGATSFGQSVDIYNDRIIVGDYLRNTVYVYELQNGVWSKISTIRNSRSSFGWAVAIHGRSVVVSSGLLDVIDIYDQSASGDWEVVTSYASPGNVTIFGSSVDISENDVVIGEGNAGTSDTKGRVHMFRRVGVGMNPAWRYDGNFSNDGPSWFGEQVAVAPDGQHAYVLGAISDDDVGQFHIFDKVNDKWHVQGVVETGERNKNWAQFAIDENHLILRGYDNKLVVFTLANHQLVSKTTVSVPGVYTDFSGGFGDRMAISGGSLLVGDRESLCGAVGSVYLFDIYGLQNNRSIWLCNKNYTSEQGSVSARTVVIGNPNQDCGDVVYNSGSKANYYANSIVLKPGTRVLSGSAVVLKPSGCLYGTYGTTDTPNGRMSGLQSNDLTVIPQKIYDSATYQNEEEQPMIAEEDETLSVYPNPTTTHVTVQTNSGLLEAVELFNAQGMPVKTFSSDGISGNSLQIMLPEGAKGVYLIKARVNGKIVMKKVIKQ